MARALSQQLKGSLVGQITREPFNIRNISIKQIDGQKLDNSQFKIIPPD